MWNNRARVPLSTLEYLFQNFPHCLGTAEGEHFWSWYWEKGPEGNVSEWDYIPRAWTLCAKYGRFYFMGEGEHSNYTWTLAADQLREEIRRNRATVVPMFKSTVGEVALHSMGVVEGLLAAGWVDNAGFWADEFVWGRCGFGRLGEIDPAREEDDRLCPYSYDIQMWLMGIAGGGTVFQLESAHQWTSEGAGAENYRRYYLPFVTAVVRRGLIPSREEFLGSLKVAVACDLKAARGKHNGRFEGSFGFLNELYGLKNTPFQEILPDNSRYGIVALLPPSATCLNPATQVIPQVELAEPGRAAGLFKRAYPERFQGEAFMWECDGTLIITNSRENEDVPQSFSMGLERGPVARITGTVNVHDYLIGKICPGGESLWFQAGFGFDAQATRNEPNPERHLKLELECASEPRINVTPAAARVDGNWDASSRRYALTLSLKNGPVECEVVNLSPDAALSVTPSPQPK
ncbi:MAG: glycoside hydrolase family 98 domain-containing protein [Kiritimatiellia bacterium]